MKATSPLSSALRLARSLAFTPALLPPPDGRPRPTRLAIGDPQAPLDRFLGALASRDLLDGRGLLRDHVLLVSAGDHFDWGDRSTRAQAADDALALLAWLAAHPPDQAVILLGNHDLARVGELRALSQPAYEAARALASAAYFTPDPTGDPERAFLAQYPMFPTAECAARDLSAFRVEQRIMVERLLRQGRFQAAFAAAPDLLLVHAGVTHHELETLGVPPSERHRAETVAEALNGALARAVEAQGAAPLAIPGLHQPGTAAEGEGGGAFFHRPADPALGALASFSGPTRRRYDPRHLPAGLTQAIGHVRDPKCRALMPAWSDEPPAQDGVLRTLRTDGRRVAYQRGVHAAEPGQAALWFLDAGMAHVSPDRVPLLDLGARAAL